MNRVELVAIIAKAHALSKTEAGRILATTLEAITQSVKKDNPVILVGFGTFKQVSRPARAGFNPATRAKIKVPAAKLPKFTAGLAFKRAVDPKLAARLDKAKTGK
ncbi:MAG: HU family DNA-binding protein [Agitococcus sp.]|nr:HU family DNA-binding protein [Agitococcus sp.]